MGIHEVGLQNVASEATKRGYSANLRDRVLRLLPLARTTLHAIIDAPRDKIDAAIDALEVAGSIGRRVCAVTGKEVITDRRKGERHGFAAPRTAEQKRQMASLFVGGRHA